MNPHATSIPTPATFAFSAAAPLPLPSPTRVPRIGSRLHSEVATQLQPETSPACADDPCAANAAAFDAHQEVAVDAGLLFYYRGGFTLPSIHVLGQQFKQRLQEADVAALLRQKLLSTFLVLAHNVHHHGASDFALPLGVAALGALPTAPQGTIAIGRHEDADSYWVMCHNQIGEAQVPRVSERLERVRTLDARQIEAAFRAHMLHEGAAARQPAHAGLGLMTVARYAREPVRYSLRRAGPKPCDRFHLYLTAIL